MMLPELIHHKQHFFMISTPSVIGLEVVTSPSFFGGFIRTYGLLDNSPVFRAISINCHANDGRRAPRIATNCSPGAFEGVIMDVTTTTVNTDAVLQLPCNRIQACDITRADFLVQNFGRDNLLVVRLNVDVPLALPAISIVGGLVLLGNGKTITATNTYMQDLGGATHTVVYLNDVTFSSSSNNAPAGFNLIGLELHCNNVTIRDTFNKQSVILANMVFLKNSLLTNNGPALGQIDASEVYITRSTIYSANILANSARNTAIFMANRSFLNGEIRALIACNIRVFNTTITGPNGMTIGVVPIKVLVHSSTIAFCVVTGIQCAVAMPVEIKNSIIVGQPTDVGTLCSQSTTFSIVGIPVSSVFPQGNALSFADFTPVYQLHGFTLPLLTIPADEFCLELDQINAARPVQQPAYLCDPGAANRGMGPEPTLQRIGPQYQNGDTLDFQFLTSIPVQGATLDATDFSFSGASGPLQVLMQNPNEYKITVPSVTTEGSVKLDFVGQYTGNTNSFVNNSPITIGTLGDTIIRDVTAPKVSSIQLDPASNNPTNLSNVKVDFNISEDFQPGVTAETLPSGGVQSVTEASKKITVAAGALAEGTYDIFLTSLVDLAGNPYSGSDKISIKYDITPPSGNITRTSPGYTTGTSGKFSIIFDEEINPSTLAISDFNLTGGGTIDSISTTVPESQYEIGVTASADSTLTLSWNGKVEDVAGNEQATIAEINNSITFDNVAPSISVQRTVEYTNSPSTTFTIVTDEQLDSSSFQLTDFGLVGGNGNVASFNFKAFPDYNEVNVDSYANGAVTLEYIGSVVDRAGNIAKDLKQTPNTTIFDDVKPKASFIANTGQADPTNNGSVVKFNFLADEPINTPNSSIFAISNTTNDSSVTVTPVNQEEYVITTTDVLENKVITISLVGTYSDLAGNVASSATVVDNSVTIDTNSPSCAIAPELGQPDPTNGSSIEFKLTCLEAINGSTVSPTDFSVSSGSVASVIENSNTHFTIKASSVSAEGKIALQPVDDFFDIAGNKITNIDTTLNAVTRDTTPPTVSLVDSGFDPTNNPTLKFRVTADSSLLVASVDNTDFTASAGTVGNVYSVSPTNDAFVVEVSAPADGTITLNYVGSVSDKVGNTSPTGVITVVDNQVTLDRVKPKGTLFADTTPTNSLPLIFYFKTDEPVVETSVALSDFSIDAAGSGLSGVVTSTSNTEYKIELDGTPAPNFDATLQVTASPSLKYSDLAGNEADTLSVSSNSIRYDTISPAITLSTTASLPLGLNDSSILFKVEVSEPVLPVAPIANHMFYTSPATYPISVGAETSSPFYVTVYNFDADFTLKANIPAITFRDAAGNSVGSANEVTVNFDGTRPTAQLTLHTGQSLVTNDNIVKFDITASEPLTANDLDATDFILPTGSTGFVITGGPINFTVEFNANVPNGSVVGIALAWSGSVLFRDVTGNTNVSTGVSISPENLSVTVDRELPSAEISAITASPSNATTLQFQFKTSEAIQPISIQTNVIASAGTVASTTQVSATEWIIDVSFSGSATVTLTWNGAAFSDLAGNASTSVALANNSIVVDQTGPDITISRAATQDPATPFLPIYFTATAAEVLDISTVASVDFLLSPAIGQLEILTTTNSDTISIKVTGAVSSQTTVSLAGAALAAIADLAGNNQNSFILGTNSVDVDPGLLQQIATVTTTTPLRIDGSVSPISFTFAASPIVDDFTQSDFEVVGTATGFIISNFINNEDGTYSFEVTSGLSVTDGSISIAYSKSTFTFTYSTHQFVQYDTTAPSIIVSQLLPASTANFPDLTNASAVFSIIADEDLTDLVLANVQLSKPGYAPTLQKQSNSNWQLTITSSTPNVEEVVSFTLTSAISDVVGNSSPTITYSDNSIKFDTLGPNVIVSGDQYSRVAELVFSVTFSEAVAVLPGMSANPLPQQSQLTVILAPLSYRLTITASATEGLYTPTVGAFTDHAGNSAVNVNIVGTVFDATPPAITITPAASITNSPLAISFTVTQTEVNSVPLTPNHFTTTPNFVIQSFVTTVPNAQYTVVLNCSSNCGGHNNGTPVVLSIASSAIADLAGNINAASSGITTLDTTVPVVSITPIAASPTNTSPVEFTLISSEPIVPIVPADLSVINGSVSGITPITSSQFTVSVLPTTISNANDVITLNVGVGKIVDTIGNTNSVATSSQITYDTQHPTGTLALSAGYASPFKANSVKVTLAPSEPIDFTTLGLNDISFVPINAAIVSNLVQLSPLAIEFTVTPNLEGSIAISIASAGFADLAGNSNQSAIALSVEYDITNPTGTFSLATPQKTNASPMTFVFTVDEPFPPNSFSVNSFSVTTGAVISNVAAIGSVVTITVANGSISNGSIALFYAETFHDLAGNNNRPTINDGISVDFNNEAPILTITPDSQNLGTTGLRLVKFIITANKEIATPVSTLQGQFSVNTGTGTLSSSDNINYTYEVDTTGSNSGTLTVSYSGSFSDTYNNSNTQISFTGTDNEVVLDYTPAIGTTSLGFGQSATTNSSTIKYAFSTNEPATPTFSSNIVGANIVVLLVANNSWEITLTAPLQLETTVQLFVTTIDSYGNASGQGSFPSVEIDKTAPTGLISRVGAQFTNNTQLSFTIAVSEDILNFATVDAATACAIVDNTYGGTINAMVAIRTIICTVTTATTYNGTVQVKLGSAAITDAAGNALVSISGTDFTVRDSIAPTAKVTQELPDDPTNASSLSFIFSVTNDSISSVPLTTDFCFKLNNGSCASASQLSALSATSFKVTLANTTQEGTYSLSYTGSFTDNAGNTNGSILYEDAATTISLTGPSGTISVLASDMVSSTSVVFKMTTDKQVDPFSIGTDDFQVVAVSGSPGGFIQEIQQQSGTVFNITVAGLSDGVIKVILNNGAIIKDLLGNPNSSILYSGNAVTIDLTAPSLALHFSSAVALSNTSQNSFVLIADEPINQLQIATTHFQMAGGSVVQVSPVPQTNNKVEVVVEVSLQGTNVLHLVGIVEDLVGNKTDEQLQLSASFIFDSVKPEGILQIAATQQTPTNKPSIIFELLADEPCNFESITLNNFASSTAAVTSLAPGSNPELSLLITVQPPNVPGEQVNVSLTFSGAFTDIAGNVNTLNDKQNIVVFQNSCNNKLCIACTNGLLAPCTECKQNAIVDTVNFAACKCDINYEIENDSCIFSKAVTALRELAETEAFSGLENWSSTGLPCEDGWEGVTCNNGQITELNLASKALSGVIPAKLSDMTSLVKLDLSNNKFTGSLLEALLDLPKIEAIDVSNNLLTGSPKEPVKEQLTLQLTGNCFDTNSWCGKTTCAPAAPVPKCKEDYTVSLSSTDPVEISVSDIDDGSSSKCGLLSSKLDTETFACKDKNEQELMVKLTLQSEQQIEESCTTKILVEDPSGACDVPVEIECPTIEKITTKNAVGAEVSFDIPEVEGAEVEQTKGPVSGSIFDVGETEVEFTATAGTNSASCSTTVTVELELETEEEVTEAAGEEAEEGEEATEGEATNSSGNGQGGNTTTGTTTATQACALKCEDGTCVEDITACQSAEAAEECPNCAIPFSVATLDATPQVSVTSNSGKQILSIFVRDEELRTQVTLTVEPVNQTELNQALASAGADLLSEGINLTLADKNNGDSVTVFDNGGGIQLDFIFESALSLEDLEQRAFVAFINNSGEFEEESGSILESTGVPFEFKIAVTVTHFTNFAVLLGGGGGSGSSGGDASPPFVISMLSVSFAAVAVLLVAFIIIAYDIKKRVHSARTNRNMRATTSRVGKEMHSKSSAEV